MTRLRFQCSDACNVLDATPPGGDAADAGDGGDAADAADGADATDAADAADAGDGGDAPALMIDADAAGADGTQLDGAADVTAQ